MSNYLNSNTWDKTKEWKAERTAAYNRNLPPAGYKRVKVLCVSCSGSGYYDHNGSPACGSCGGTGKSKELVSLVELALRQELYLKKNPGKVSKVFKIKSTVGGAR